MADAVPLPTITIAMDVINLEARTLLLAGCDEAATAAEAAGQPVNAYYQKVRDRLAEDPPETPKITIPEHLYTPEVIALIQAELDALYPVEARPLAVGEDGKPVDMPLHHQQTIERLGLK